MHTNALIDWDHLEKYVIGDDALRDEILTIFVEQAGNLIAQFDAAQTDEGWRTTAHTLKGAARGIGAWELGALCEEAEEVIGGVPGKCETRSALLISIRQKLGATIDAAKQLRDCA